MNLSVLPSVIQPARRLSHRAAPFDAVGLLVQLRFLGAHVGSPIPRLHGGETARAGDVAQGARAENRDVSLHTVVNVVDL